MTFTREQIDSIVNEKLDEYKAQQEKRNAALKAFRSNGRIIPGTEEQMFLLLEREGMLVEEGGKYLLKTQDKYGYPIKEEIPKVLPSLLAERYSHFAADTGTEISQSTASFPPTAFNTQELYKLAQEGGEGWLKALEQVKRAYS